MHRKISLTRRFDHNRENSHKAKSHRVNFKLSLPKNPLARIEVTSTRNFNLF